MCPQCPKRSLWIAIPITGSRRRLVVGSLEGFLSNLGRSLFKVGSPPVFSTATGPVVSTVAPQVLLGETPEDWGRCSRGSGKGPRFYPDPSDCLTPTDVLTVVEYHWDNNRFISVILFPTPNTLLLEVVTLLSVLIYLNPSNWMSGPKTVGLLPSWNITTMVSVLSYFQQLKIFKDFFSIPYLIKRRYLLSCFCTSSQWFTV